MGEGSGGAVSEWARFSQEEGAGEGISGEGIARTEAGWEVSGKEQ